MAALDSRNKDVQPDAYVILLHKKDDNQINVLSNFAYELQIKLVV